MNLPYRYKRVVVKIGTSVLAGPHGYGLDKKRVTTIAGDMVNVCRKGCQAIIVSSGAIGAGMDVLQWDKRPTDLRDKQVASAIGQVALMEAYTRAFQLHGITVGQVLLTREDLNNRERYLNVRNTLLALMERGIVPVINENDAVSTDEIQFGDNDTLAAIVAVKVEADLAVFLSDVDGIYRTKSRDGKGQIVTEITNITSEIEALAGSVSSTKASIGGMSTKIIAAKTLIKSGIEMWIANGRCENVVSNIVSGSGYGTRFVPGAEVIGARKRWIAFGSKSKGKIIIDSGAVTALVANGKSLLPSGIVKIEGEFGSGDSVSVVDAVGREIAKGLTFYSSDDLTKIKGVKSIQIAAILGRRTYDEVIHRNNLVLL